MFDVKDFVQVSHDNLQVEDETEEAPGSGVFTKGWRYATVHRDKINARRVVLYYGKYEYEGMDQGVTYTLTMDGGEATSGLDQQEFTGENGVLKDGDGDVIPTRLGPDKAPLIFKRNTYRKVSAAGLEVKDEGEWKPADVLRTRKSDGHVVVYYGMVGGKALCHGLGLGYKLENVPFDEYFTGANGVLKDGHGLSIECRWNGAAAAQSGEGASGRGVPAAKTAAVQRAGKREGTRANAAKSTAGAGAVAAAPAATDSALATLASLAAPSASPASMEASADEYA